LQAVLSADTRDFDRAMGKSESGMRRVGRAAGVAGAAIAAGLGLAVRAGVKEMIEAQKVTAQTNAVIKSTGGAANVSAAQVDKLAESLMLKSGVDDEAIKSGANLLLTFTNIRNEAGAGNDIFNQTTKATLDLSVAMGKDLNTSALLVGKAMNQMTINSQGNVAGFMALRRVGVQFTAEQMQMAAQMIESGNIMGAQKILLQELQTEFGGSAEAAGKTLGGQLSLLREQFSNLMAEIVEAVLPAFTKFLAIVLKAVGFLKEHTTFAKILVVALGVLAAALIAASAAATLLNLALLANPIGAVVLALAALAAGLVIAYNRSETFRRIVDDAFAAIKTLGNWIQEHWGTISKIIENSPLVLFFRAWWNVAKDVHAVVSDIVTLIQKHWNTISAIVKNSPIVLVYRTWLNILKGIVSAVKWLIENIGKIPTPNLPDLPKIPNIPLPGVGIPIPGRQHGGPVAAGRPYLVGERGMELFVPSQSGRIVPGGGGDTYVTVHLPNYLGDRREVMTWMREAAAQFGRQNARPAFGGS
jgi:hypothetical protein